MSLLTLLILLPLTGAVALLLVPRNYRFVMRLGALATTLLTLIAGVLLFLRFDPQATGFQFVQRVPWVPAIGIQYYVGVDGINVGLVLMAAVVAFAAACVSWEIRDREKEYYVLLLTMTGGVIGAFASLDLFLFYFFHELALVPTFIMIGIWGRGQDRGYAAFKMTLYLSLGALLALVGLIALYLESGVRTFDMVELARIFKEKPMAVSVQRFIFPWLLFGFGILVSLFPFHTWAPRGYAAAPTAASMLHAGVLKKFGLYGLIRVALPMLPVGAEQWMHWLIALSLGNILFCGLVAVRQRDLNYLIGNSSVAHMGFVFLGIASFSVVGVTGAVVIMVAHGLLAALSFALTGHVYQKHGTLNMDRLGGLLGSMPFIGAVSIMAMMAGCGLPGFANFAGEVLVFFGISKNMPQTTVLACWGALVIGAVYMLRAIRSVWHGPLTGVAKDGELAAAEHLGIWRKTPFVVLLGFLLLFGMAPGLLTTKIRPSVARLLPEGTHGKPTGAAMTAASTSPAANHGMAAAANH